MYAERRSWVRFYLAFWLFVLSGVAFLDRTNLSIAGLQISTEYGLGNQRLGWIFSAFLMITAWATGTRKLFIRIMKIIYG